MYAIRRYLGIPSKAEPIEISAVDAARYLWLLSTVYRIDKMDGAKFEDLCTGLKELGMDERKIKAFVGNPGEAIAALALADSPTETVMHAPSPCAGGMATVFEGVEMPDFSEMAVGDSEGQSAFVMALDQIGPQCERGSPEDLEMWEASRQSQIAFIEELESGLEGFFEEKGKRDILGIPSHAVKEQMAERLAELTWLDAPMWAAKVYDTLPDVEWLEEKVDELVTNNKLSESVAYVLWRLTMGEVKDK